MKLEESDYTIAIGLIIFAVGLILEFLTDLDELYLAVIFGMGFIIVGYDIAINAAKNLLKQQFLDENFLMVVAATGAFIIGEYPEGLAVLLFFKIGEAFEDRAVDRTRRSVSELMDIRSEFANVIRGDRILAIDPSDVEIGEVIVVKPGEKIPLDGVVVDGDTSIDTRALTGESVPKRLYSGDNALSGCVNMTSVIKIEVSKAYEDSTVARILTLIEESASKKSKSEKFITKFARYYTPAVVCCALLVAIIPSLIFPDEASYWIYKALMFLVVSCPCALVVSIPLTLFCGIGCASENGILTKGSNYLEVLASANTVVFDKTGTLTKGDFSVTIIEPADISEEELIELAAKAEFYSDHPISVSIKNRHGKEIDPSVIGSSKTISGKGVRTEVNGKTVYVGNSKLMEENGIAPYSSDTPGTHVHVAVDGTYAGHIVVSDMLKDDSRRAVSQLRNEGITNIVMLTGDTEMVGVAIAAELELDEVHAELLPQDKIERLEALLNVENRKGSVVFVGDGINDAPSLARADVGVAMGAFGTDAAIESADVVIMDDSPSKIASIIRIAKHTMAIVKQNIVLSIGLKFGILFLIVLGTVGMWTAIFADIGVLIIAILNSTRALRTKELSRKDF